MEVKFYGANCVRIITKQRTIVIDDNLSTLGLSSTVKAEDSLFYTSKTLKPAKLPQAAFLNDGAGEFELGNLMVQGYAVRAFTDDADKKTGVLYTFSIDRMIIMVTGHIHPSIETSVLESIGDVDALIVPIGNNEYTLDALSAEKIANKVNPRYLIPTHFNDSAINYPSKQDDFSKIAEEVKLEIEVLDSLKLKPGNPMEAGQMHLVQLKRL